MTNLTKSQIEKISFLNECLKSSKSEIKKGSKPFLAITIENDDYSECGKLIKHE